MRTKDEMWTFVLGICQHKKRSLISSTDFLLLAIASRPQQEGIYWHDECVFPGTPSKSGRMKYPVHE